MKAESWRWILRGAAIASLWPPYILRWEHPMWRYIAYAVLAVLAWDTLGLFLGIRKSAEEARKEVPHLGEGGKR